MHKSTSYWWYQKRNGGFIPIIKNDFIYLEHILESLSKIEEFVKKIKYQEFLKDSLIQGGVIWQFLKIGESTMMLSKEFREKNTQIPWKDMAGMRNKLIHGYFDVNLDIVWDTIKKDVPFLKTEIKKLIKI